MKNILKRNIFACYVSDMVLGTYFQLPIWIVYQSKFLNFEQIAFFASLALIIEVLMQMPTGAFADLYGRKTSLALGNLFMALPMFLIAAVPRLEIMWLYAFMWGLGCAFCMGTSKPILYDTLKKYKKENLYSKIISKSALAFQISAAVSIASGGYLYQLSPSLPYYISGITSMIGVVTSFIFIEPKIIKSKFEIKEFIKTNKQGFVEIFKNSYMVKLTILFTLMVGVAQASQQFLVQPYMLELGMNDIERSWVSMIIKIVIALIGVRIVSAKKIFENKFFILIIPIVLTLALIPARFTVLPLAYIVFIGVAFSSGNTNTFISPEVNENISSSIRSTAISAQRMISSLIRAIIQWLSAFVIVNQSVGSFYTYLGIFCLIVIFPLALNVMNHKHRIVNAIQVLESNSEKI